MTSKPTVEFGEFGDGGHLKMAKKQSEPALNPFKRGATVTFGAEVVEHPHRKYTGASPSSPPPDRG